MPATLRELREEHRALIPSVEHLRSAADHVGADSAATTKAAVDHAYGFLVHELLPHAHAEDHALYPVVGNVMGAPDATRTMSRDHVEVERLTAELGALASQIDVYGRLDGGLVRELRRVLYGLYALVRVHFAKEEEVYVPLLEASLSEDEAAAMLASMHHEAHEARVVQDAFEHDAV